VPRICSWTHATHLKPFKSVARYNCHHNDDAHVADKGFVERNACMDWWHFRTWGMRHISHLRCHQHASVTCISAYNPLVNAGVEYSKCRLLLDSTSSTYRYRIVCSAVDHRGQLVLAIMPWWMSGRIFHFQCYDRPATLISPFHSDLHYPLAKGEFRICVKVIGHLYHGIRYCPNRSARDRIHQPNRRAESDIVVNQNTLTKVWNVYHDI